MSLDDDLATDFGASHLSADELRVWLDNELPPEDASHIEDHLERCDTCALRLETLYPAVDQPGVKLNELANTLQSGNRATAGDILHERYELGDEIARGGMGVIYRAFDNALQRDVAIKVLSANLGDDVNSAHRFYLEAQIGGQLEHPGIASIYDVGQLSDGRTFIAMKLVKGETLAALLAKRKLAAEDQTRFLQIFEQVCRAVDFAHARGVLHRDLKPANVMVGEFGEVQVMDWGLAKLLVDDNGAEPRSEQMIPDPVRAMELRQRVGTPGYMPPEQHLGMSSRAADVFGLGAILSEILTGEVIAENLAEALQQLESCESDSDLLELARDCLQANASDRPKDAGVVATRTSGYLDAIQMRMREAELQAVQARMEIKQDREKRRRNQRIVAVAVSLAVVGGLLTLLVRNALIERDKLDRAKDMVAMLPLADTARVPGDRRTDQRLP